MNEGIIIAGDYTHDNDHQFLIDETLHGQVESLAYIPQQIDSVAEHDEPDPPDLLNLNSFPADPAFESVVRNVEAAIDAGVLPTRISQGSSGSYFVRDIDNEIVGVFKPKSEEPYSLMNPKYGKWCQRVFCPCCFGRNCLLKNQGYLSEAGASVVDEWLGLHIVPKTKVVWLSSKSFHYSKVTKAKSRAKREIMAKTPTLGKHFKRIGLPLKVGSFQLFVKGFKNADVMLKQFSYETLPMETMQNFQLYFEKLVVLDYIVRNTDRGNDNWLIKVELESQIEQTNEMNVDSQSTTSKEDDSMWPSRADWNLVSTPKITIAAIDNGLAFPYKHPDTWRAYPYHWAWLQPYAETPFSEATVKKILPMISDLSKVEDLCCRLEELFSIDNSFNIQTFEKQMAIMRGQMMNLCDALNKRMAPADLVELPLRAVERQRRGVFGRSDGTSTSRTQEFRETFQEKRPFFTWC